MSDETLSAVFTRSLLAGGLAGCSVDLVLFPLDSLKTRLQAYKSGQTLSFKNPYSGLASTMLASFPCAATFWATYMTAKRTFRSALPDLHPAAIHLLAAACGSTATSLVRTPFEVVKQQMQLGLYTSNTQTLKGILAHNGALGLFAGFGSLVMREIPFDAIQFLTYERLKYADYGGGERGVAASLVNGAAAGGLAAFFTTPIDVVKTRLMTQKKGNRYTGILQAIGLIYKQEGLAGLWSGWKIRMLYITTGGMLFFGTFEAASKSLAQQV